MAISLASSNKVTWSFSPSGGTATMAISASPGDVLYVIAANSVSPTLSGETFTTVDTFYSCGIFQCKVTSSHSGSNINLAVPGAEPGAALAVDWTGVNNASITVGSTNSGSGATSSASVTTAAANSQVIGLFVTDGPFTLSAGSGATADESVIGADNGLFAEHNNSVTASSGTSVTLTASASMTTWSAVAIALAPAGGSSSLRRRSHTFVIA